MLRLLTCALTGLLVGPFLSQPGQAQEPEKAVVHAAAAETIDEHYPERNGDLEVQVRRVRGTVDTTKELRLQFSEWEGSPVGVAQAHLQTRRPDGEWQSAGWALLEVARFDSVATLHSRVEEDEPIPASALQTAWIETTDLRGEPLRIDSARSRAHRQTLVATRHLQSGRVLRRHDVRRPHTINVGASVRVVYRQGRVVFRISCTAREAGVDEEVIRVHCAELETTYRARIINENTAEWVETL